MLLSWSRACFTLAFRPFLRNEPQGGGAPHLTVKHGEADNFLVDSPETSKKLIFYIFLHLPPVFGKIQFSGSLGMETG